MSTPVGYNTPQSQQHTSQQQSQMVRPMGHSLQGTTQGHPLLSRLETLIQTIGDAGQRDDLKLKALQEISNSFEEMATTPAFQIVQENLLRTFLKIFQDTVPQFIGENNTQQLRKLILELILRMNCNEIVKQYAKLILTQLTKVIQVENEENAVIAIKIISEHQRAFRAVFTPEIPAIINHFKAVYRDMPQHITSGRMFEQRNLRHCGMEDSVIESSLQNCYMPTIVYLPETSGDGNQRDSGYSLIPRASQSVKVLSEVPMFCIILFQIHRHHIQNELMEIISLMVQYCSLSIPHDQQINTSFSTLLADEFYTSQVRALTFLGFISSRSAVFNVSEVVSNHGTQIVQSIMQMLERCPHENYSMRRELIGTVKNIFVTDLQTKFIPVIPKLFNENLMLGNGFSSMDFLRPTMYTMLADLVHHVRGHLSYNLLCCSVYAFTKSMFDPAIQPTVQSMCIKLMMNLIESFVITEKNHPDQPCRDILFCLLENYVRKLKWLARYQVPVILEKNASNIMNTPLLYPDRGVSISQSRSDFFGNSKSKVDEAVIHNKVIKEDPTSPLSSENDFDFSTWDNENEKNIPSSFCLPASTKAGKTSTPEEIFIQYWVTGIPSYTLLECRNMIRVLVQACKHAVHALKDTHATNHAISPDHEAKIIEQLFRYGLRCLDIYVICPMSNQVPSTQQRFSNGVRTKEEKEVLELFGSIFTLLNPSIFKEIISRRIDYFIERLASNYGLQIICSSLLVNSLTSANFGDILIRFLIKKLPDLAECSERSFLWLKLFKIVFSSVGSQPSGCAENERMLRPYLHDLVLHSMELALRAREPINYFLLLRALFRSIGGGSYDLLYQTFLPLLPTLLHQLNRLQSSTHRAQMRELFIELCLTVPVRLSSLLPYLPLLMDPLVCALNGSSSLIQQGLRTLELCVDNLQPDYLYEHMAPVRAELIRGLWQCMASQEKNAPQIAFRILGKFGASNRKMLTDPQNLVFKEENLFESPAFQLVFERPSAQIEFSETLSDETQSSKKNSPIFCELNISEVVKESVRHLRSPFVVDASFIMATAQTIPGGIRISSLTMRRHAFRIIRGVILSVLAPTKRGILRNPSFKKHLTTKFLELRTKDESSFQLDYECSIRYSRSLYLDALLGLFYATAAVLQEATSNVMDFFCMVMRHLTIQIIFEQCHEKSDKIMNRDSNSMDYTILIDSVLLALTDPCKEVCQTGLMALKLICETTVTLLGSMNKAANTIFFQQILERATNLCYNEPWCIRLGGCLSIKFILINFPQAFVINNIDVILCALFEVIVGLVEDVSSSAVDVAVATLDLLLKICFGQPSVRERRKEAIECVVGRIIENLLSPSYILSRQCQKMLTMLADYTGFSQCELLAMQNELLKKFLENGMTNYKRISLDQQIVFEDSFVFIFSVRPVPLEFIFDKYPENDYVSQLLSICNATGKELRNKPNYKPSTRFLAIMHHSQFNSRLITLRQSTIRALVACCIASCGELKQAMDHDPLFPHHKQIFEAILKCLMEENEEIQDAAFGALKEVALSLDRLRSHLLKMDLGSMITVLSQSDSRLQKHIVLRLLYLLRLFPDIFSETFCSNMLDAFRKFPDPNQNDVVANDVKVGRILLEILAEFPLADASFVHLIIPHVRKWEAAVAFESSTSWRYPLMKYLTRFPLETLRFFVMSSNICEQGNRELFKYVVKHEEAIAVQEKLMADNSFLLQLLQGEAMNEAGAWTKCDLSIYDMEMLTMKLIVSIGKRHPNWAGNGAGEIIKVIQSLWNDKDFRARYTCKDYLEGPRYDVPKLAALIMLRYFKANIDRIDILFDLCHVFTNNYIGDFTFVRLFIEKEIIPKYPIEWRQNALKRIVAMFEKDPATAHDLNVVKMLQYVVIPSLHYAFERYDVDVVVGTPAKPDDVDDNNLISLVCQKVLDRNRFHISDAMLIQLFHLGCLFVSNCPTHIHDFSQKKQGNRLRILMLLGWPCLSSTPQDQTMKYMGHLLIANIINQFNINRKIVLQVFLSLLKATLSDPKDIIKRSLDILTPSVPLRMDDGHKQLMTVVKKTIVEEGHNVSQIFHCLSMIVRHYKIYYNVRHQMLQVILNGVQRLMLAQGTLENRRIAIDVCEMVIKWEQWRLKQTEELEKRSETSKQSQTETTGNPSLHQQSSPSNLSQVQNKDVENIHRPIEKAHVDHVVNMLVKLSSAVPDANLTQNPTQHAVAVEQLCKRCLGLLRACLKSNLWGLTANLRLSWLEKQLTVAAEAVTQQFREQTTVAHHFSQLHTSLDIITHLVVILPQEVIVTNVKMLQRGIVACLNCQDNAVMRSLCQLVSKLFEKTKCSPEGLDELETINQFVTKFINDTFTNYEKGQSQPMTGVFATIHLLRTICVIQPAYVDTMCLSSFTKAVQKLVREHVSSCTENKGHALTELIIFSLELLRPRIHTIPPEARRNIGQCILTPLIDKTPFDRVLDIVIRVVDIMVRNGDERQLNQGVPLLIRLVQTMEAHKRHEKSGDLLKILLETVLYVYETAHLRTSETLAKLNSAFHWGLCAQDESLRSRFFKLFDAQVPKNICDRLYHIITSQNWADMQQYFWIKHCINLLLSLIMDEQKDKSVTGAEQIVLLNCCTLWRKFEKILDLEILHGDHPEACDDGDFLSWTMDITESKRDDFIETSGTQTLTEVNIPICSTANTQDLQTTLIVEQQVQLFEMAAKFQITDILPSYLELVYSSNDLASKIWIKLFSSLWSNLQEFKQAALSAEMVPFLSSGCHLVQRDLPHSAVATFLEAVCRCRPPIPIHPSVLMYISIRHRAWHRGLMILEDEAAKIPAFTNNLFLIQISQPALTNMQMTTLNNLILLYSKLSEFDQYQAIWKRRAYFEETSKAIEYYNEGDFVRAEKTLRESIETINDRMVAPCGTSRQLDITPALGFELREWHRLWADCERELGEWDALLHFGNTPAVYGLGIVADAAWHLNDWNLLRVTLTQLEGCTQPDLYYKYYLYKAMLMNHYPVQEDRGTELLHVRINRELEAAREDLIMEWKRLPEIISFSHVSILQAANLIQEVQEASVLTNHPEVSGQVSLPSNPVGDVKSVVKAWRSRSYALSDPLSFWTDIHQWRIHHYNTAIRLLQQMEENQSNQFQQGLLPFYSAANSQIMIARAARKAGLIDIAIDKLSRIHTLPALPAMDAYFSVREFLKCLVHRASMPSLTEEQRHSALMDAFSVVQKTTINAFTKENIAKLYCLRGRILTKLKEYEDANHSYKTATLLHENVAGGNSVWLHWADFLESRLDAENTEEAALNAGMEALVGIMEGARMENELRARKYIARLLWLVKKLSVYGNRAEKEVDAKLKKHGIGISANNWLPWLPQLVAELQLRPSLAIAHIISHVGESSEQQVFYAIAASQPLDFILENVSTALDPLKNDQSDPATSQELFRDIIRKLCQSRPVEISSLCGLLCELNSMKEHWLERTFHKVNQLKDRLFVFAHKNLDSLTSLSIPEDFLTEIKNWRYSLNDFTGFREINEDIKKCAQDIESDFDIQKGRNDKLTDLLKIVVKWSSLLATKFDKLPSKKLIRNVSQVLASYSSKVANVEIFNGYYAIKSKEFSSIIYRFMPYYFVIRRADVITRRISVRALSGRVYSYYLTKHHGVSRDASGIHQFFALINHFLTKEKETCRRFLQIAVPHFAYIGDITLLECTNKMNSLYTFEEILNAILKNKTDISCSAKLIERFYDRTTKSPDITNQLLVDEFRHMTSENILPPDSLSKWLILRYDDPTHYYTLRKQVALNMSMLSICEYILHLNPATMSGLCLNTRTGQIMNVEYLFGLNSQTLKLEVDRVVPYRMSPNLHKFLGFSVEGHYNCSIVATIRCLHARKIVTYAQLFLWDAFSRQRKLPVAEIFKLARNAGKLLENRLNNLYKADSLAECVAQLTQTARKDENLARLDPRLHPWF
ncbi:FAT domain family protein [Acanthocheilonema viteae]